MGKYEGLNLGDLLEDESIDFESDGEAQYAVAMCYLDGKGVEKNTELGNEWLEKAAQNGYKVKKETTKKATYNSSSKNVQYERLGQYELYKMQEKGDAKAALAYARIAIDKGEYQEAIRVLEQMEKRWKVRDGEWLKEKWEICGIAGEKSQDIPYAKTCYKNALELGNKNAEKLLVKFYENSDAVQENDIPLIQKLAQKGNAKACFALGTIYMQGELVECSNMKAIVYFNKALGCADIDEIVDAKCKYQLSKLMAEDSSGKIPQMNQYMTGIKKGAKVGDQFCRKVFAVEANKKNNRYCKILLIIGMYVAVPFVFYCMRGAEGYVDSALASVYALISTAVLVGISLFAYFQSAKEEKADRVSLGIVIAEWMLVIVTMICIYLLFGSLEGFFVALKNGIVQLLVIVVIIAIIIGVIGHIFGCW